MDYVVVAAYLLGLTALGLRFARRQTSTETYFVARRSIPFWATGLSLLAAIITSVTFVAYPGSAYDKNWALLMPGFMVIIVVALAGFIVIPFFRHQVGMSAYEYFGKRFGDPVRIFASFSFTLVQFSKMTFVLYLVSLTVSSVTGWPIGLIILISGALTILYTLCGGLEAVIWTDCVQGLILWAGIAICLGFLLFLPPGGPSAVFRIAWRADKFSLGDPSFRFSLPTIPVLIIYGLFWYLQKYTADQLVVQRYLAAKSDREAIKGVLLGSALCIPAWALFMLVGTCTWSYYRLTGEKLPSYIAKADQIFPYFLTTHVPTGIAGLILAALLGAAMCALASDLNSLASTIIEDVYSVLRPEHDDRIGLRVGKWIVAAFGTLCVGAALVLVRSTGSALSMWYTASAIASGGLAGLFLLAFLSSRASRRGAYCGIIASLVFTVWASLTLPGTRVIDLGIFNFPWHDYMIGAISNVVLSVVGYLASLAFSDAEGDGADFRKLTVWYWLRTQRNAAETRSAGIRQNVP